MPPKRTPEQVKFLETYANDYIANSRKRTYMGRLWLTIVEDYDARFVLPKGEEERAAAIKVSVIIIHHHYRIRDLQSNHTEHKILV